MSSEAMTWAGKQRAGGTVPKFILNVLADYADEKGLCYPSIRMISERCEISESTTRRGLQQLIDAT